MKNLIWTTLVSLALAAGPAAAADFDAELQAVMHDWAVANYRAPDGDAKLQAFESLAARAADLSRRYPRRAESLAWEGIVLSTWAGAKGGLGALSLVKQSRQKLEAAERLAPDTLEGSVYTSLGTLYHKVPGWPISFGDDEKAATYLHKALRLNPDGIDPNFFYGEFLADQGDARGARRHLDKALHAPARPARPLADEGRRAEIRALLNELE